MTKIETFDAKGVKSADLTLADSGNELILAQAIRVYESHQHPHLAHVKTRSNIRASKKKIYRQKGTGGARHGSISAPIFVGGGIAHGPKNVKRYLTFPKSWHKMALSFALKLKVNDNNLVSAEMSGVKKTGDVQKLINALKNQKKDSQFNKTTVVLSKDNKNLDRYFKNINNMAVRYFESLNAYDVVFGGFVILDKAGLTGVKENKAKSTAAKTGKSIKSGSKAIKAKK